jgi:hypothetical protein
MSDTLTDYLRAVKERVFERRRIEITHISVDSRSFDRLLAECSAPADDDGVYCIHIKASNGWLIVEKACGNE